jgi:RNA polymerase sigma-70 factor, ECF subfamily
MMLVDRLAASTISPSRHVVHQELLARLGHAIAQLPPTDHEIIVLKHLEEMSFSEAAVVLGLSDEAVRSRYRRAVLRLHRMLSDE